MHKKSKKLVIGRPVVHSSTRTTQYHARHGFKPRMDRLPVARIAYPAVW